MSVDTLARRLAAAALVLVFVLAGLLAFRQVGSLDAGFHLRAGEFMLSGGGWPRTDPFTYTVNDHAWVDTSWGYQVLLALIHRLGGPAGLTLLHVALVVGTLWVLWKTARIHDADPLSSAALLTLAVLASEMRFEVRPEVLSYLLLAAVLYVLHRHAAKRSTPLWVLPVLFFVWANCHSLIVLGFIALGCFIVGGAISDRKLDRRVAGWSVASLAAAVANPYGIRALTFPFELVSRMRDENVFGQSIGEFVPPLAIRGFEAYPFVPVAPLTAFKILLLLVVVSALRLLWTRRYAAALLALPALILSLQMVRNLPLLPLFCVAGAVWTLPAEPLSQRIFRRRAAPARAIGAAVLIAILALFASRVVHDAHYIDARRAERFGPGWNRGVQPVEAAAYLERTGVSGPMLNHLNFGGFLMWARDEPVFIDGRLEVMGESFYERYRAVMSTPEGLAAAVARHDIRYVVFPHKLAPRLLGRLSRDRNWRMTWVDPLAVVFARRGVTAPVERATRQVLAPPKPFKVEELPGFRDSSAPRGLALRWIEGVLGPAEFPQESFGLGLFHYFRGELDHAAARFAEAIRASDGAYYEIYNNLGSALARLGRLEEAARCYRFALAAAPDSPGIRERLERLESRIAAE